MLSDSQVSSSDLHNLYALPELQVKLLWHNGFWDGPLDGVCEYNGRRCSFSIVSSTAKDQKRLYRVTELSSKTLASLEEQHARFQHYVGTHTDYDAEGIRSGAVKPQEQWNKFYKPTQADKEEWKQIYKASLANAGQPSGQDNLAIGWFRR